MSTQMLNRAVSSADVTGMGFALPGAATADQIVQRDAAADPVDPAARIGKKGLRYKDRATALGLVAAYDALIDAGVIVGESRKPELQVPAPSVAVIVSSNYGNVDSVCDVISAIAEERSSRLVSPIVTPNLSSNVIASEIAIRNGLRGPNLTVCSGDTAGLDALHWATTLLAAGRADHALVVGVEPGNDVVRKLTGHDVVLDGAVGLVLSRAGLSRSYGRVGHYRRSASVAECLSAFGTADGKRQAWFSPDAGVDDDGLPDWPRHDLSSVWGMSSGALGVLQCAAACGEVGKGELDQCVLVSGGGQRYGCAGLAVTAGSAE